MLLNMLLIWILFSIPFSLIVARMLASMSRSYALAEQHFNPTLPFDN